MFTLMWLIRYLTTGLQPFEQRIVAQGFGLWCDDMRPHWSRLFASLLRDWKDVQHALINLPVEWAKLDPQRAAKVAIMDQAMVWAVLTIIL